MGLKGNPIRLPEGMSPEQLTRRGLQIETDLGQSAEEIAPMLGIAHKSYRMMRDIVLVYDRKGDLSAADKATVTAALDDLNATARPGRAHPTIEPILARVFGQSKYARRTHEKIE